MKPVVLAIHVDSEFGPSVASLRVRFEDAEDPFYVVWVHTTNRAPEQRRELLKEFYDETQKDLARLQKELTELEHARDCLSSFIDGLERGTCEESSNE